ncbi:MAG: sulfite exporter TauE/SafE family protein, partial [Coriobacteriaceae bacterium]|nr:sulfite exporter TauE/SafE family protein [Coriobacteriaceae bacterium]
MAIICAMELLGTFIGLAVAGIFIGVLSGMLGIGGGTVMVPLLRLVFGLDAYMATATSLFAIIPTSLSGMISHLRAKTCYPKLGLALGLGGAATSSIGVYLGSISPAWAIMVVAAVIILYSAFNMLRKALRLPSDKKEKAARAAAKADAEVQMHHIEPTSLAEEEFALTGKKIAGGVGIG